MKSRPWFNSLIAVFLISASALASAAEEAPLNNASVLELVGLNLGDEVVIGKTETSQCHFDTSISGMKQLKEAEATSPRDPVDLTDPLTLHAPGIWMLEEVGGVKK